MVWGDGLGPAQASVWNWFWLWLGLDLEVGLNVGLGRFGKSRSASRNDAWGLVRDSARS